MIDELSLGLAPAVVAQLLDVLRALHARGTTILLVEQSVNVALTVAQPIAVAPCRATHEVQPRSLAVGVAVRICVNVRCVEGNQRPGSV